MIIGFTSCTDKTSQKLTRQLIYFQGDAKKLDSGVVQSNEPIIQKGDNLSILVSSLDRNTDQILNMNSAAGSSAIGASTGGYLVDFDGNIQFPQLGTIKAAGLTKSQLQTMLLKKVEEYVKDPVINIRFLNYRVSV